MFKQFVKSLQDFSWPLTGLFSSFTWGSLLVMALVCLAFRWFRYYMEDWSAKRKTERENLAVERKLIVARRLLGAKKAKHISIKGNDIEIETN